MLKRSGFTLVELLVVISIIAILAVIGLTIYTRAQQAARDARRRADIEAIAKAMEQYKVINSSYPTGCDNIPSDNAGWTLSSCGLSGYIQDMPKDPLNSRGGIASCDTTPGCYLYKICIDTGIFVVAANLETTTSTTLPTSVISDCAMGGGAGSSYVFWIRSQQ
ncbi:prepilin-type N-terminal cleavage/methylation domain-containing protein [Candidatus Daviesbacteria bacterium]|nr:prepilin-type N-terminal cleavage/methylation domain-containing protein [Candidatus Daviesbacteria bacterium]